MKVLLQRILTGTFLATIAGAVSGAMPPPQSPFEDHSWKAISKTKPSTGLQMGSLDVQFEKTTLAMVRKAVGRGEIAHQGDAGASIYWLCYTIQTPKQSERVWIIAHGEMGGREHAITEVTAQAIPPSVDNKDCPSLPAALQPVSFAKGLWLGTSSDQALSVLGHPSHQKGLWWVFDYQSTVPGNCKPDGYLVMNWFLFQATSGNLVRIHAGQVTSC